MNIDFRAKRGVLAGAIIGAVLGAGVAYMLIASVTDIEDAEELEPIKASDLLSLTAAASVLLRRLSDVRRRL